MRLADPWLLLLALPAFAAILAAAVLIERRRAALTYPPAGLVPDPTLWAVLARRTPHALRLGTLLLCAAALARPQHVRREAGDLAAGVDIFLVLDTSRSMEALDFSPKDRLTVAKETAARFISGRVSDRIGLIVFGGAAVLACPLTLDYEPLLELLASVEARATKVEGTAIGDGIAAAVGHLRASRAKSKVVILLTDGSHNAGAIDPLTAAKAAAGFGVKVYTIGTGTRGQSFIPVDTAFGRTLAPIQDELDEDSLMAVAAETGGLYFRATSPRELQRIFSEIDRLEKTESRRPVVTSFTDLYAWLLVPAALLLALELALARTLLLAIP